MISFRSLDFIITFKSSLSLRNAWVYIEIVALITAPFDFEKKWVKSEPPPPKLTLTGALDLAKFLLYFERGKLFLLIILSKDLF